MPITAGEIDAAVAAYLERQPQEHAALAEPLRRLAHAADVTSRHGFPMHITVGALVVRYGTHVLLGPARIDQMRLRVSWHALRPRCLLSW